MGAERWRAARQRAPGRRLPRDYGRRRGDAGAGLLPRKLRLLAAVMIDDASTAGRATVRLNDGRAVSQRRLLSVSHLPWRGSEEMMPRRHSGSSRATPQRSRSGPTRSRTRSPGSPRASRRDVHIVRNGSRGLFWLEPMVEVETAAGRVAYGPVRPPTSLPCSKRTSCAAARIRWPSAEPKRSPT